MARSSRKVRSASGEAQDRTPSRSSRIVRWVLLLIVLAVLAYFPGRWAVNSINEKQDETNTVEAEILSLEAERARFVNLEGLRAEFDDRFADARAAVPESQDLPGILEELVDLERSTGAKLLSILPSPPEAVTSPGADPLLQNEMRMEMVVSGRESAVVDFVSGLRDLTRTIVVDSVALTWPRNLIDAGGFTGVDGASDEAVGEDESEAASDLGGGLALPEISVDAAELDPDIEVVAALEARAFVWAPGALPQRLMAEVLAGDNPVNAPGESEDVEGEG